MDCQSVGRETLNVIPAREETECILVPFAYAFHHVLLDYKLVVPFNVLRFDQGALPTSNAQGNV